MNRIELCRIDLPSQPTFEIERALFEHEAMVLQQQPFEPLPLLLKAELMLELVDELLRIFLRLVHCRRRKQDFDIVKEHREILVRQLVILEEISFVFVLQLEHCILELESVPDPSRFSKRKTFEFILIDRRILP